MGWREMQYQRDSSLIRLHSEGPLKAVCLMFHSYNLMILSAFSEKLDLFFSAKENYFIQWNLVLKTAEQPLSAIKQVSHHIRTQLIRHMLPKFCCSIYFFFPKDTKQGITQMTTLSLRSKPDLLSCYIYYTAVNSLVCFYKKFKCWVCSLKSSASLLLKGHKRTNLWLFWSFFCFQQLLVFL